MNGCNMSRITTHHATHSLMASHNARDVPTDGLAERGREEAAAVVASRVRNGVYEFANLAFCVTIRGGKQKKHGVLI